MDTVGASEAKAHFSRLLARAAKGETILITKNGKPIAQLEPWAPTPTGMSMKEVIEEFREYSRKIGAKMSWAEIKAARDKGRR